MFPLSRVLCVFPARSGSERVREQLACSPHKEAAARLSLSLPDRADRAGVSSPCLTRFTAPRSAQLSERTEPCLFTGTDGIGPV